MRQKIEAKILRRSKSHLDFASSSTIFHKLTIVIHLKVKTPFLSLMFCAQSTPILTSLRPHAKAHHLSRILQYVSKRHNRSTAVPAKPVEGALALEIYKRIGYRSKKRAGLPKGDRSRLNIVSEDLCGLF
jgi:hypothetical protein